ncbi:hypothetical protein QN277_011107 [Acacia crassicarpa]|uniref:HMA domain-containing protein n=1 Tax=Acacia crassicarpa TaxID=499986 RepID=A0AAE1MXZ5_9FABA|nr:hypothetical protein QN277_011107 [Acacia crassicarpa]
MELPDDSIKRKAMKFVSGFPGVESVSVDMKDKKLTLTGDVDPESIVGKLRKLCRTEIVSVEEEKEDKKKEKKEDKKGDEPDQLADLVKAYQNYYRDQMTSYLLCQKYGRRS